MGRSISGVLAFLVMIVAAGCVGLPNIGPFQSATPTPVQKPGGPAASAKAVTVAAATQAQAAPRLQFSGTLESTSQVNIVPQVTAKLDDLAVGVGSQVKAGDIIAQLQSDSFRISAAQSAANLAAAQAKYQATLNQGRPENVANARAALDVAQTKLAQLQNPSPSDVQAAQSAVDTAQANLNAAEAKLQQTQSSPLPADLATAQMGVDTATASLASAQAKLDAVKNPFTQADWAAALAAADTARGNLQAAQAKLAQTQAGSLPADIAAQQAAVATAYNNLIRAQDQLDQFKTGESKGVSTTGLTSAGQAEQNVQQASDAYDAAVAKLQQMLAGPLPSDLQTAVSAVTTAQASFNSAAAKVAQMKTGPLATDVAQAQDAVNSAQANLSAAQAKLQQTAAGPLPADLAAAQTGVDAANANAAAAQAKLNQLVNPTPNDVRLAMDAVRQAEQQVALQVQPFTQQDIDAAKAAVDQAQALVDTAQFQLSQTTVKAPFDGTVTAKLTAPGAVVSPSTPIVTLASNDLDVLVSFAESQLSVLKPGLNATLTVAAYPGQTFTAKVVSIYPSADPRTHTFIMRIVPDDPNHLLKAGMFANIVVEGETHNAVFVPLSAVVQVNGQDTIFVVVNGRAEARQVVQGTVSGGNVEIVSGVNPGDEVVASGTAGLNNGDAVRVTQPGQPGGGGPGGPGGAGGQGGQQQAPGKQGGQGAQTPQPEGVRPSNTPTPAPAPGGPPQKP